MKLVVYITSNKELSNEIGIAIDDCYRMNKSVVKGKFRKIIGFKSKEMKEKLFVISSVISNEKEDCYKQFEKDIKPTITIEDMSDLIICACSTESPEYHFYNANDRESNPCCFKDIDKMINEILKLFK